MSGVHARGVVIIFLSCPSAGAGGRASGRAGVPAGHLRHGSRLPEPCWPSAAAGGEFKNSRAHTGTHTCVKHEEITWLQQRVFSARLEVALKWVLFLALVLLQGTAQVVMWAAFISKSLD
jgi:hypothetical protein